MTLTDTASVQTQFRRVNAYPGLMVDADVWRTAHDYHRDHLRLHQLALHGWGIVQGLDVSLVDAAEHTLRIEPGIGIDAQGNFLIVGEPHQYQLTSREARTLYLVLQFREVLADPGAHGQPTRILEAYRIQERDRPPNEPYLELARVDFDPQRGPLRYAANPDVPLQNELDLRARVQLGSAAPPVALTLAPAAAAAEPPPPVAEPMHSAEPAPVDDGRVDDLQRQIQQLTDRLRDVADRPVPTLGEHTHQDLLDQLRQPAPQPSGGTTLIRVATLPDWDVHHDGLARLAAELGAGLHFEIVQNTALSEADVVYLSGHSALSLSDVDVEAVSAVLRKGGTVIGEGCASGLTADAGAREFALSFVDLGTRLGRQLSRVDRGHALLTGAFTFADPPAGARPARLMESGGMAYSDADYGCAWVGGAADKPLPRSAIRDAVEFGANLLAFRPGGVA